MAPTNTAIECVSGNVGRYCDKRTVLASPESAGSGGQRCGGTEVLQHTNLISVDREVFRHRILWGIKLISIA